MRVIKIIVERQDQAQEIVNYLVDGEENGIIEFGYTCKVSDEMTRVEARAELMR